MIISHVGGKRVSTPEEFRTAAGKVSGDELDIRLTQPVVPEKNEEAAPRDPDSQ
jgi:hypothetical protein